MFLRVTRAGFQKCLRETTQKEHYDKWAWCNNNCFLSPENQIYHPSLKKNNASQPK